VCAHEASVVAATQMSAPSVACRAREFKSNIDCLLQMSLKPPPREVRAVLSYTRPAARVFIPLCVERPDGTVRMR
jgi:hypothetical protein